MCSGEFRGSECSTGQNFVGDHGLPCRGYPDECGLSELADGIFLHGTGSKYCSESNPQTGR